MFGVRVIPMITRTFARSLPTYTLPKFQYSLANK